MMAALFSIRAAAAALGGDPAGSNKIVCPGPGHSSKDRSLSVTFTGDGTFVVHSFANDDWQVCRDHVKARLGIQEEPQRDEKSRRRTESSPSTDTSWQPTWRESTALWGSLGEAYLLNRLGRLPIDLTDLRHHPRCPRGGDRLHALVALMRDAVSNQPTGIHRTYLNPDGSGKADIVPAKMMLGRAAGSVVKLTPNEDVTIGLGLSEGIEDGLAIINSGWRPVWACLSAGGMASFPVLKGIEALTVFCDADSPGRKAAAAVVQRWRDAGLEAVIAEPPAGVKDFGELHA